MQGAEVTTADLSAILGSSVKYEACWSSELRLKRKNVAPGVPGWVLLLYRRAPKTPWTPRTLPSREGGVGGLAWKREAGCGE